MSHFTNLRLLRFSSHSSLFFRPLSSSLSSIFFNPSTTPNSISIFASSYSSPKKQSNTSKPFTTTRRNKSSFKETTDNRNKLAMAETESAGFNRKRAEGKDKNDNPKNLKLKVRKLNPVNTICYVQVLGTGMDTQDTSPSVLLFFDKQRFIFNAGEGLQRFCTEHKIKLSKIDHIFLSRVCSETAGGLPGLLLTLAGIGDEGMSVNAWGPSDFKYLVDAMKSFIPNAAMVHAHSFGPKLGSDSDLVEDPRKFDDPIVLIDDEVVKISAILLRPSASEEAIIKNVAESSPEKKSNIKSLNPGEISVIYVCELPEIKGKFDPKKAANLGLRPGPKYRELQLGNSVMSDRQNIMVHPSDVLGPSVPGPIVLLVDCPTLSHLKELLSLKSFSSYYADPSNDLTDTSKIVNCVIHLSPSSVINTSEYRIWMSKFGGAQHILAGHEMKNIEVPILKSSARIAARLNYLCPQFFPAPGFWSLPHLNSSVSNSKALSEVPDSKLSEVISAENLLKFHLRPYAQLGLDRSFIPPLATPSEIIDELVSEIPEIVDAAQQVSQFWHDGKLTKETVSSQDYTVIAEPWLIENEVPNCLKDITREDAEIVLLGTGSSQPSKYRNVTSIFINLFSKGSILLDCGEGTLGQLKRRFGIDGADDAVRGLRCIWISHIHADHHTGLARILARRRELLIQTPHEPIIVVGPGQLKRYLDAYGRLEDLDMQFLNCRHTTEDSLKAFELNKEDQLSTSGSVPDYNNNNNNSLFSKGSRMQSHWTRPSSPIDSSVVEIVKKLKKTLGEAGLESLVSFPVIHCPQAFGVALKAADRFNNGGEGWKIVYSGDTRPCPELIKASHGATVLIHEATFEDALLEEAIARNHSTTKEAVEVGDAAGVYRIILTHFSQRYPKIPVFEETHMHKTCIAFDMMSVNLADLQVLPRVLPHLKLLFKNEMIAEEFDDDLGSVVSAAAS